jgi:membrane dipeptidase
VTVTVTVNRDRVGGAKARSTGAGFALRKAGVPIALALWVCCQGLVGCSASPGEPPPVAARQAALDQARTAIDIAVLAQVVEPPPRPPPPRSAREVHFDSIVIDTHIDTVQMMEDERYDLGLRHHMGHVDLPRMDEGGLDAAFFSIWVDPEEYRGEAAYERALTLFLRVHAAAWRHPELVVAQDAETLRDAVEHGHIVALLGVEGAHALGTRREELAIERLHLFRALGARYMTITWATDNPLGHASTGDHPDRGLTDLGFEIVREMERIGMIVDVSHVSDATFDDILDVATRPVMASHSSARALADHPRNLSDRMIRRVAINGGVVCVNYYTHYIDAAYAEARAELYDDHRAEFRRVRARDLPYTSRGEAYRDLALELDPELEPPDLETVADHIMHIVEVGGVETACLGSDFDGIPELPRGFDDVSDLPSLSEVLMRRGLSESDLEKVLGGNVLRVLEAAH